MTGRRRVGAALLIAVGVVAVLSSTLTASGAAPAPATAQDQPTAAAARTGGCQAFLIRAAGGSRSVIVNNDPTLYTATTYVPLGCGSTSVFVPSGRRALVVVKVDAEVVCTGPAGQWCLGRVLIGGVEGQPRAPEPDSFSWAHSDPDASAWESNAFTRTAAVGPCRATAGCVVTIAAQARTHATGLTLRVDDSTVDAEATYF